MGMFDSPRRRRRKVSTSRYKPKKRRKSDSFGFSSRGVSKSKIKKTVKKGKGIISRVLELGFHGTIKEYQRQRELAKQKAKTKKIKETLQNNQKKTLLKTFFKR